MKPILDETHDARAQSWVESANAASSEFPIQNLPFGVFRRRDSNAGARVGIAIGDRILDLTGIEDLPGIERQGLLVDESIRVAVNACSGGLLSPSLLNPGLLNPVMALPVASRRALRRRIHSILRENAPPSDRQIAARHLIAQVDVDMLLPASIGDYTDFYASIFHATNVGRLFRPDNPLLPNYKYIPIGYHGRSSSVVPSGTPVQRPSGQTRDGDADPKFGPTKAFDYEMELGFFVSSGNSLGESIPIGRAEEHIFGVCLVNDWSARDIQSWEYQPLGPFLAKSFATSISPWVVTMDALAPFRTAAFARAEGDPAPLPYLLNQSDRQHGGLDLWLEVSLRSVRMREADMDPWVLGRANFRDMYWTMAQMLTHHASNGCNLRVGDLLASGTVSGADESARGCLLEQTSRGKNPVTLPTGEQRKFLEDGDEVILRGFCEREGFRSIGLGSCRGTILAARVS
jgi:fumarylacetoacetase